MNILEITNLEVLQPTTENVTYFTIKNQRILLLLKVNILSVYSIFDQSFLRIRLLKCQICIDFSRGLPVLISSFSCF